MLSLVSGVGRLCASASAAAATSAAVLRRGTVIVARKHELDRPYPELDGRPIREFDDYPDRVPVYSKLYETAEHLALLPDSQQLLSIRLAKDVPGLGESGQTVSVHRSRYWHYLYPLGLASICSAADSGGSVGSDWRNSRVFTGPLFRLQRTLESLHLLVPINRDSAADPSARLSERHLCVAFRRYGLEIPRRAVRLPEKPPPLSAQRAFKVDVQLNNRVTVQVKASIHAVTLGESGSGLPPARLPQVEVDDWLTDMYPEPAMPKNVRVFDPYLLQQGPPDFEHLLRSNRTKVKK